MHSPRARALLRSGRHSNAPRPTMGHQGDRHHASSKSCPTRGKEGPQHPAEGPQARPPARGPSTGPRPGPKHLGAGRLQPGTGQGLPVRVDQAPLAVHRDRALHLGQPQRPHTSRGGPRHTEGPPPPRRQHSLTCKYQAIHRVLRRMDLSPPLEYPLPTTDKEVHRIRTLICKILTAAAEEVMLLLKTSQPTRPHTGAPLQADTYTNTTHTNPAPHPPSLPPPLPLPPHSRPSGPHTPTKMRSPWSRHTGVPRPPNHPHTPATDPPAERLSPPPTPANPHRPTAKSLTPQGTPNPAQ